VENSIFQNLGVVFSRVGFTIYATGVWVMNHTISEITQIWDKALIKIEERLGEKKIFDSFFEGSFIFEISGDVITIVANSALAAQLMKTKYYDLISEVITEITESNFRLEFIKEEDLSNNTTIQPTSKKPTYFEGASVNPNLTFDNFVVGPFNREASQASLLIARNPGKMFNPLYIHSNSGLGKTHLLHAIGNYIIKEGNPNAKILYITGNDFIEEYIKFVKGDKESESLKEAVCNYDVLLFDDVQFLVDKVKTEEMFFYIYQKMVNSGKQIVITSDKHPNELKGLEERLVTRFNQGLVLQVNEPDENTCVEILKEKIAANGLDVNKFDPAVLYFFADKFSNNVRELEGALNRLIFHIISIKQTDTVTMDIAAEAVSSLVNGQKIATELSEQKIINIVADYYDLTPSQLTGKIRTGQIALARHIAMYLIRFELDVPLKKIGATFGGKDHTTVMNAISHVDNELKTNVGLQEAIKQLKEQINA